MSPFRAVFVVPSLSEASTRIRVLAALPGLAEEGCDVRVEEVPRHSFRRLRLLRGLRGADVVVVHRKLFDFLEFAFLRRNCRRLVFDFDDAILYRDSFRGASTSRRLARRFANAVKEADAVVAGNPYLKDLAIEAGARGEVRIIPSAVDVSRFPDAGPRAGEGVVLGWIGTASTLPYLTDLLPLLDDLAASDPGYTLRVICSEFPAPETMSLDPQAWSEAREPELLTGIDIGLMPLRDDRWSRGKCGYKILQYFAARKPVVASAVGVNVDLVRPGETGFLARSDDGWLEGISRLASDRDAARRMGAEGFRLLEGSGFTLEAYVSHLASFLRTVA